MAWPASAVETVLTSIISAATVLAGLWLFFRRNFDAAILSSLKRERAAFKELVETEVLRDELLRVHSTHERALRTHDAVTLHVAEFRNFRNEISSQLQILITIPGAVQRMTASLDRFDEMVEGLIGKVQQHEVHIAEIRTRMDRGSEHRRGRA